MPLPLFFAGIIAVGKAIHAWSQTEQGKALIRTTELGLSYYQHKTAPSSTTVNNLQRAAGDFGRDVAAPSIEYIVRDASRRLHPPTTR